MRFIPVKEDEVCEAERTEYAKLTAELQEFVNLGVKAVKIVFGTNEYANAHSACNSIRTAIKQGGLPIKVRHLKDSIYLIRTDI